VRVPCGWPDVTPEHVPADPDTHRPGTGPVHVELQQVLSTQMPLWHCGPLVQLVPLAWPIRRLRRCTWRRLCTPSCCCSWSGNRFPRHCKRWSRDTHSWSRPTRAGAVAPGCRVSIEPEQLCERHETVLPAKVHIEREAEVQEPAQGAVPPQAVRMPCGSPDVTAEQSLA